MSARGIVIAAPSSGAGKTTITLGLARAMLRRGYDLGCAKSGPDYIDSAYLSAASYSPCQTLDSRAMGNPRLTSLAQGHEWLLIEGAMGLFDGAKGGEGSVAALACALNLPVILVVDAKSMSHSIAAIVNGFLNHRADPKIVGIILNKVGSPKHGALLLEALSDITVPILGMIPRHNSIARPSRHLGLVQAQEHSDLDYFLEKNADLIEEHIDFDQFLELFGTLPSAGLPRRILPLGSHIAIAQDAAFSFTYPHMIEDWRMQGAKISTFSPLANQPPNEGADAVFLPGGYPELHGLSLARAGDFRNGMVKSAANGAVIYGECGGYMCLGKTITDKRGVAYPMCGLLPLETSFSAPKLHLGYRDICAESGPFTGQYRAHEFHYASVIREKGTPLFTATDASGKRLPPMGLHAGNVSGSFAHIIDHAP